MKKKNANRGIYGMLIAIIVLLLVMLVMLLHEIITDKPKEAGAKQQTQSVTELSGKETVPDAWQRGISDTQKKDSIAMTESVPENTEFTSGTERDPEEADGVSKEKTKQKKTDTASASDQDRKKADTEAERKEKQKQSGKTSEKQQDSEENGKKSSAGKMVALDAGHQLRGDSSTEPVGPGASSMKAKVSGGATGVASGVPEYQLNLTIALKLKSELQNRGYTVFMIRSTNDVRISNAERARMANDSGADICIRIHADGVDNSSAKGASALYPSSRNPYVGNLSRPSEKLSRAILDSYCRKTGLVNRGLSIRDDLTGTNWSEIPVTLLEMGFLSNPSEDLRMQDEAFQRTMVQGIADGVDAYFSE